MNKRMRILAVVMLAVSVCGCAWSQKIDDALLLKELSDEQRQTQEYLAAQEKGFALLSKDIASGSLHAGILRERIEERYGEPIYCKKIAESDTGEMCLYRRPTDYFSSDKAYLYFDSDNRLASWEFQPHG